MSLEKEKIPGPAVFHLHGVTKIYTVGEVEVQALKRGSGILCRRVRRPSGPLRQRQVHPAQHPGRTGRAHQRARSTTSITT